MKRLLAAWAFAAVSLVAPLSSWAQASCYPGVPPTAAFPNVPKPSDRPYLTWRSWGWGAWWYCLNPGSGKWTAAYTIGVYKDILSLLSSTETLESVVKLFVERFDGASTPDAKRAVIDEVIRRFSNTSWKSCSHAIANDLQPYRGYCEDIAMVACGPTTPPGQRCNAMPDDLPPPSTGWVVAPTSICAAQDREGGICVRRQSFSWDGERRGITPQPERATIGAPCVTTIGVAPYFGFDPALADRVVQCVKR